VWLLESNAATLRLRVADLQKKSASREELQARETSLAPVVSDLWDIQRAWQAEAEASGAVSSAEFAKSRDQFAAELRQKFEKAGSYAAMYQLIGQELWVARQLLDSVNPEYIRAGMTFALSASRHALSEAQNGWVAARICDGYLLPHLDMADDTNRRSRFNRDNLLTECADIFRRNEEFGGVVRTYQVALAAAGTPQKADTARAQISMAYEQAGDFKQALHYLREIKETNDFRWAMRRAPRLEQQLKSH
jgi:tetratricopeptide (TPR) repeat protein